MAGGGCWRNGTTGLINEMALTKKERVIWKKICAVGFQRNKNGCLEYSGYLNEFGYGQIRTGGRLHRVHRLAFKRLNHLCPEQMVLHTCDNPKCSEPTHLRCGTQADNIHDMLSKGRGYKQDWKSCPKGHPYPPERQTGKFHNRCHQCDLDRKRRHYRRKYEEAANVMASG